MAKYFVTRSAIEQSGDDFTAAMQHAQIGPFETAQAAREAFATYLAEKVEICASAAEGSTMRSFLPEYARLAATLLVAPSFAHVFETDTVRWTIHAV